MNDRDLNYPTRYDSGYLPSMPSKVEGLSTSGLMGTMPAPTVGGIMAAISIVVSFLSAMFGWSIPAEYQPFFDQYGQQIVGVLIGLYAIVQAAITYFKVFAPSSVAARYEPRRDA